MKTGKNQNIVLILADIHHRVDEADKIIHHVKADQVIALGVIATMSHL